MNHRPQRNSAQGQPNFDQKQNRKPKNPKNPYFGDPLKQMPDIEATEEDVDPREEDLR